MLFDIFNREKLEAKSYENPIRCAVLKQCPEVADGLFTPYGSNLSGDEILSILCEAICPKLTNPGGKITLFNNVLLCSFLINIFNIIPAYYPLHVAYHLIFRTSHVNKEKQNLPLSYQ